MSVILVCWWLGVFVLAAGAGDADEVANGWTALVVGPIVMVYAGLAVGLIHGQWRTWRLLPLLVLLAAAVALAVQGLFEAAGRAYAPEPLWLPLLWAAPFAAYFVVLLGEWRMRASIAALLLACGLAALLTWLIQWV